MNTLTLQIAAHHPTGAGHFPGNPIIPGALLLADVIKTIADAEQLTFVTCNIKQAKFQRPARPGDSVEIDYTTSAPGQFNFQCNVAGSTVLTGAFSATVQA